MIHSFMSKQRKKSIFFFFIFRSYLACSLFAFHSLYTRIKVHTFHILRPQEHSKVYFFFRMVRTISWTILTIFRSESKISFFPNDKIRDNNNKTKKKTDQKWTVWFGVFDFSVVVKLEYWLVIFEFIVQCTLCMLLIVRKEKKKTRKQNEKSKTYYVRHCQMDFFFFLKRNFQYTFDYYDLFTFWPFVISLHSIFFC